MNEIKVNMVKFLMTMFEGSSNNANEVRLFKSNVDELVRRNQIPNSVRNLIYNMYGIANTDTFKPNAQSNKLMQINMLMMQVEGVLKTGSSLNNLKSYIDNGVQQGTILKSARDTVFDIYDLASVKQSSNTQSTKGIDLGPVIDIPVQNKGQNNSKTADKNTKSKEVQIDIAQFKSQYVPEIYYEYPNPNFDGCSGSSVDLHMKLIDAKSRPSEATFVIRKLLHDDGCHQSWGFVSVPKEYYKPTTRQNPYPVTSIKTPTTGSSVGCTGGGYSMRTC